MSSVQMLLADIDKNELKYIKTALNFKSENVNGRLPNSLPFNLMQAFV